MCAANLIYIIQGENSIIAIDYTTHTVIGYAWLLPKGGNNYSKLICIIIVR